MKKYYYTDGTEKFGPFTLEELKQYGLKRETLVWYEGLGDAWQPAGEVGELSELFRFAPPSLSNAPAGPPPPQAPPPAQAPPQTQAAPNQQQAGAQVRDVLDGRAAKPKNWLVESILATLFCCLIPGIVGIIYAAKVDSRFYAGDVAGAEDAAKTARTWTLVSFGLGLTFIILYIGFIAFVAATDGDFDFYF